MNSKSGNDRLACHVLPVGGAESHGAPFRQFRDSKLLVAGSGERPHMLANVFTTPETVTFVRPHMYDLVEAAHGRLLQWKKHSAVVLLESPKLNSRNVQKLLAIFEWYV